MAKDKKAEVEESVESEVAPAPEPVEAPPVGKRPGRARPSGWKRPPKSDE